MTDHTKGLSYWLRVEAVVLVVAVLMSLIGTFLWSMALPRPSFGLGDLILPSCLTWAMLAPLLQRASIRRAIWIGLASPFVGSVFVILLGIGPAKDIVVRDPLTAVAGLLGGLVYATSYIGITSWATLPCGAFTGLLVRGVFRMWPPEAQRESPSRTKVPLSLKARLLWSALALIPLLGLLLPNRTPGETGAMQIARLLTALYFAPLQVIYASVMRSEALSSVLLRPWILATQVTYAVGLFTLIFRTLGKRNQK